MDGDARMTGYWNRAWGGSIVHYLSAGASGGALCGLMPRAWHDVREPWNVIGYPKCKRCKMRLGKQSEVSG